MNNDNYTNLTKDIVSYMHDLEQHVNNNENSFFFFLDLIKEVEWYHWYSTSSDTSSRPFILKEKCCSLLYFLSSGFTLL